jgi:hypothetical protein
MSETAIKNRDTIKAMNEKIEQILAQYRLKHDELELAEEEWDIGEIQEALATYTREINILKQKVHLLKESA